MNRIQEITDFLQAEFPQFPFQIEAVGQQAATLRFQADHNSLRPGGTISGPTMFAIADASLYIALLGERGVIPMAVTTNMNINFLSKPNPEHDLIARCQLVKLGRRSAVGQILIYSEGQEHPVAQASGTYAIPADRSPDDNH